MSSKKIHNLLELNKVPGDVGIEIEIEGKRRFPVAISDYWRAEADGSLRGYSMEYVMRQPAPIGKVGEMLDILKKEIEAAKSLPVYSERAGVHVHVNVQQLTMNQVFCMALTYYCLEHALVKFCGENREGNHFCLRLEDADYVADVLYSAMYHKELGYLNTEDIRYSSLNFCSLFKYGSLEFRSMETQPDFSKIEDWAKILIALRDWAIAIGDATKIPFEISAHGPTGWARGMLGDDLFKLINYPNFDVDVMRCMRPIQHLFYARKEVA